MRTQFLLPALVACTGTPDTPPADTTTTDTVPTVTTDTGWPGGDVGNFHVAYNVNLGTTEVFALAAASPPSYINLAQCGISGSVCIPGLPGDPEEFIPFDVDLDLERDQLTTKFLGYEVTFGPYTMAYREDTDNDFGFGYYALNANDIGYAQGWIGESWGGQWPEYSSDEDLYVPRAIEILAPKMDGYLQVTNGSTATIEWTPTGDGIVTLAVVPAFSDGVFYWLTDDGYASLNVDDWLISSDQEDLTFVLSRWSMSEISRFGHVVNLEASSSVSFTGQIINIGGRENIDPVDQCAQATGSLPLESGSYWSILGGELNGDMDPPFGCLVGTYADARGPDGIYKLEVGSHNQVGIDYNLFSESASVYFVRDCDDDGTCFNGSDLYPDPNVHEYISYFNSTDDDETIYLIVDQTEDGAESSVLTLDVQNDHLDAPTDDLHDECADAEAAVADGNYLDPGSYYSDFVAYTPDLNPGIGGCTASSVPGPDAVAPVILGAGQTLSATLTMGSADGALYVLYDCNTSVGCPIGSDASLTDPEGVVYTNVSAYPQTVYLAIDSKTGLGPYFLSLNVY